MMDISGSVELKKDVYEVQHILLSDVTEDLKWKSVKKLHKRLMELEFRCSEVPFYDLLCIVLKTLPVDSATWKNSIADDFFLKCNNVDSFMALLHHIDRPTCNDDKIIDLLEMFIVSSNLKDMILDQCTILEKEVRVWDEIIVSLTSLPERMANRFRAKTRNVFCRDLHVGNLVKSIYFVLGKVQEMLTKEKDVSLEFITRLLGKLCVLGYGEAIFDYLCPRLVHMIKNSFSWRRICQRLITGIPPRCMESVLTALLQKLTWYGSVEWFLGDCVNSMQNVKYLMMKKFLLIRYFEKDSLPKNVLGYLAHSESRRSLFYEVVLALLDVWSDGSALKHQSYLQQMYLSRLLMIATGYLKKHGTETWKQDFIERLLNGVHNRIASSQSSVRILGMVVAESMSSVLNPEGPKLDFEYEKSEEVTHLHSLLIIPEESEFTCGEVNKVDVETIDNEIISKDIKGSEENTETNEHLDSDDDLEPYDLSTSKEQLPGKRPLYLIECLNGLLDQEKADWFQTCLESAEDLIQQEPDNLNEVSVDMCKVLLHLENNYALPNFADLKQGSLVALCVHCPKEIAVFLSGEFYNRNYSVRQRIDVLQVLAAASRELSGIEKISHMQEKGSKTVIIGDPKNFVEEDWKHIIAKRVKSKTRVISKKRESLPPKVNKFANVAGHFFFPLIAQFDKAQNTFDLLDNDTYLLGHFIYALGIIMYSALNVPFASQMGKCLLEFIWALKYHNDKFIQKALLFSVCMTVSSIPSSILLSDFQEELFEYKQWLQNVINENFDPECKMIASQALLLILQLFKEEGLLLPSMEIL